MVRYAIKPGDVAPVAAAALRTKKLFQPLVAEHQHRIGLDHQLCPFVAQAPRLQFLRREQMQEILLAIALYPLLRVGRAEQLPPLRPAVSAGLTCVRCAAQAGRFSELIFALQWAIALGHKKAPPVLAGPNPSAGCVGCVASVQAEPTPVYEP